MGKNNYCFNCRKQNVEYTNKIRLCRTKFNTNIIIEDGNEYEYYDYVTNVAYCKVCGDMVAFTIGDNDEHDNDIRLANNKIRIKMNILTTEEIIKIVDYIGKEKVAEKLETKIQCIENMCNGLIISKKTSNKLKGLLKEVPYKKDV